MPWGFPRFTVPAEPQGGNFSWDGMTWQPTGEVYDSLGEAALTIYASQPGLFALAGPTYPLYLPAVLR